MQIGTFVNSEMNLITNSATRVSILNNGNVGIGSGAGTDSMLTVENGARFKRGVRMSGLPSGVGIKSLRVDANGTVSLADTLANGISGTGTTNYLPKFTSSSAIGNSQIFDNGTNVGIGSTTPLSKLHIEGTAAGAWITINRTDAASNIVDYRQSGTRLGYVGYIANDMVLNNATASNTIFNTSNTERLRITSGGLVGIGTSAPEELLEILSATSANIRLRRNGTLTTGDILGKIDFFNADASGDAPQVAASVRAFAQQSNGSGGYLTFNTATGNTGVEGADAVERMRLDASGNLGLGVTPKVWSGQKALDFEYGGLSIGTALGTELTGNAFYNGTNWIYNFNFAATRYEQAGGQHKFYTAPSGTAGNAISFTQAMTLDASGRLGIGTTSPATTLETIGQITTNGAASGASVGTLQIKGAKSDSNGFNFTFNNSTNLADITNSYAGALTFGTNNTERMRITSGGELLVNTTSDAGDYKLQVNGNAIIVGSISTGAPTGGTARPFKIGQAAVVTPTSPNRTIEIEIDGVTYYLSAKTTNN